MFKKSKRRKREKPLGYAQRLSALRDQLDAFLNSFEGDDEALQEGLSERFANLKPYDALPALIRSYEQTPASLQERLDGLLPNWLAEADRLAGLQLLLAHHKLSGSLTEVAKRWLESAGIAGKELAALTQWSSFIRAFKVGNEFQETVTVFFYTDRRKLRARGLSFLIDYNPPWEGAVKDVHLTPGEAAGPDVGEWYLSYWLENDPDIPIVVYSAEASKSKILTALQANFKENIRAPRDLISAREAFLDHILSLPDQEDTPSFSAEDFDRLLGLNQSPEALTLDEQRFGYRTRRKDGKEIRIIRNLDPSMLVLLDEIPDDDD